MEYVREDRSVTLKVPTLLVMVTLLDGITVVISSLKLKRITLPQDVVIITSEKVKVMVLAPVAMLTAFEVGTVATTRAKESPEIVNLQASKPG